MASPLVDENVLKLLGLESAGAVSVAPFGHGASSASTAMISTPDGTEKRVFLKTATTTDALVGLEGERAGLDAIRVVVPDLCPLPLGSGTFISSPGTSFLLIEFLQLSTSSLPLFSGFLDSILPRRGLAQKLAKLHTTPAPIPTGFDRPQFGFPVTTYCGDTPQDNSYKESWADFFANNRLLAVLKHCEVSRGEDANFRAMVEAVASRVVPRLLDNRHLNNGSGIVPVVVHGDLWCGNAAREEIADGPTTDIIFDPSACFAHSEYELGIMKMFGGFGKAFLTEYHKRCPKTEPVDEYDDRVSLYELYHYLNHFAIFGNKCKYHFFGDKYKSGAAAIMRALLAKYGS